VDLSKLKRGTERKTIAHLRGQLDFDIILPLLSIEPTSWRGEWVQSHCPNWMGMHEGEDGSPSFGINTENLGYNCFVCGGGGLEELVAGILNIDTDSAIEWLEEHANVRSASMTDLEFQNQIQKNMARVEASLTPTKEKLPEYPADLLFQYDKIHPYVWERGLNREVVIEKQIGFSEEHMGIAIPHWFQEKLVGIQFRHLALDDNGRFLCPNEYCNPPHKKKTPKYYNTPHFPRGTTLYNYDTASHQDEEWVIVVESPFTALYLMSQGYWNTVATFGAGLSDKQGWLLSSFYDGVFFWPDNDPAGSEWFVKWSGREGKRYIKGRNPALVNLEKLVPTFVIPALPGNKADPADARPGEIARYHEAHYPTTLYPMEGLRIGYAKDN
jgi:hypothetical protein